MSSYPNQKMFTINREDVKGKQYLSITCENVAAASRNLSGEVPFKLYLYLCSNSNGYKFAYSPQAFSNIYGCSLDSAKKAVAKLIDAGYLVETSSNHYSFYETSQKTSTIAMPTRKVEVRLIPQDDGTFTAMNYHDVWAALHNEYSDDEIKEFWNECEVFTTKEDN